MDTVCGAWNLNRDWIETGEIDCIVGILRGVPGRLGHGRCGGSERMETEGEIIVLVDSLDRRTGSTSRANMCTTGRKTQKAEDEGHDKI